MIQARRIAANFAPHSGNFAVKSPEWVLKKTPAQHSFSMPITPPLSSKWSVRAGMRGSRRSKAGGHHPGSQLTTIS
jgi:hypothetical protein